MFANAGITEKGSLLPTKGEEAPSKPDLATLNVNLVGVIYCKPSNPRVLNMNTKINLKAIKLATHYMSRNSDQSESKGLIVCTASNAGLYPFVMAPMYAATKAGVIGLVRSLARALEAEKIQINALAPAVVGKCHNPNETRLAVERGC